MMKKVLIKQTLGHFCVDATCAAIIIGGTENTLSAVLFFVLYNFLAFCMQPLAGILLDKITKIQAKTYILTAFILLLLGFVPQFNMWLKTILVGVGNCLFHVGAGALILTTNKKKMAPLGIFVSSGAVGLTLGTLLAHNFTCYLILLFSLIGLLLLNLDMPKLSKIKTSNQIYFPGVMLLCLCIAIRSFMGFTPLAQFEKTPFVILTITLGVFIGKSLGGILCDKWGIQRVISISTIFVMILFLFSFQNPYLWSFVQMIVNLSMPITLYLMYKSMPQYPAFSFGLAASCLVIGLLATFILKDFTIPPYCFLILFVINSGIILYTERKLK